MAEYNKLSQVTFNPMIRAWRFRVQLHKIYPYAITNLGTYYKYILADEDGYKMEMTTGGDYPNFRGLEKEEGRWVEIFVVEVERTYPGFQPTRSPFRLNATRCTQVRIIEPLNSRVFLDFKSIHEIPRMHWRDLKYPIDTMGVVFNMETYLDAPSGPRMEFYIRDNIDHQIKCVVTGNRAYAFRDGLDYMSGGGS
ncbi:unnamed protein product [Eruca vesicaria subsp. sativa]|uniref:Replication protein A 70 kDa DNA-binding subunit B/D first OB fold domain-containing protein n=1 Tax=Eruca vesicaria subsp. sativa TaxID=29727 RepID=A0ABC8KC03_ERUVS|nr:unnamed protein product [Eruca vesicaria subsp. sativa]